MPVRPGLQSLQPGLQSLQPGLQSLQPVHRRLCSSLSRASSRRYLEHESREATLGARARDAQVRRAESAFQSAVSYLLPKDAVAEAAVHAERSGQGGGHAAFGDEAGSHVERAINRAVREGLFDDLENAGKPLRQQSENVFEVLAGETTANRILKQAGCAPAWIELRKEIRHGLADSRRQLAIAYIQVVDEHYDESAGATPAFAEAAGRRAARRVAAARGAVVAAEAAEVARRAKARLRRVQAESRGSSRLDVAAARRAVAAAREVEVRSARAAATAVRSAAADAATATKAAGAEGPEEGEWDEWDDVLCHRWEVALAEFEERCAELNARIDNFNLIVPGLWQQLPRVTLAPAVNRAIDEAEALLAARRAGSWSLPASARRNTGGAGALASARSLTAFGASFALADVEMPSLASALGAIFARPGR